MQNLPVYLYNYKLDITLDLDTTVKGVNQVMYQRDLKIAIKETLEFTIHKHLCLVYLIP